VLLSGVFVAGALAGGWLWLRSSPLAAVAQVQISGVHGPEASAIEAALDSAARDMNTLDVNPAALRAAVSSFGVVREVHAVASFPHDLRIRVVEQLPVAALLVGGQRTAVAADGMVLGPALLSGSLPVLAGVYAPAAGARLRSASMLAPLAVLGAAPTRLAPLVARAFVGTNGVTLAMHNGLLAYFGDATRPRAKWLSLARVLADPSSAGASYIDVRLPERPAAGFPAGTTPPAASSEATAGASAGQTSTTEAAVAELAAGLTPAGTGAAASGREAASAPAGAGQSPPTQAQAAPGAAPETGAGEAGEASPTPAAPGG